MRTIRPARIALQRLAIGLAAGVGLAAATYAAYAATRWLRYGRPAPPAGAEADALLDQLMPTYDIVERRHIRVAAPAGTTLAAAYEFDIQRSPIIQVIFKSRSLLLGGNLNDPEEARRPHKLVAWVKTIGWRALAEEPGREIVLGTVTQPWKVTPAFQSPGPAEFARFDEPGYVKIAWTLRADPDGEGASIFRHETRALATDPAARAAFRRYWAIFSPGIVVIRWIVLDPIMRAAEAPRAPGGGSWRATRATHSRAIPAGLKPNRTWAPPRIIRPPAPASSAPRRAIRRSPG